VGSVIFIDTSAFVAILAAEDDASIFLAAIDAADTLYTGAHVRLECGINLMRKIEVDATQADLLFDRFLLAIGVHIMPVDDPLSRLAMRAYSRFGKGRGHPAQLNFGDCLSYACAFDRSAAILFKGRDFIHTDLALAIP
jgi:ribonuclease VapC